MSSGELGTEPGGDLLVLLVGEIRLAQLWDPCSRPGSTCPTLGIRLLGQYSPRLMKFIEKGLKLRGMLEATAASGGWEERCGCSLFGYLRERAQEFLKLLKSSREVHSALTAEARMEKPC